MRYYLNIKSIKLNLNNLTINYKQPFFIMCRKLGKDLLKKIDIYIYFN